MSDLDPIPRPRTAGAPARLADAHHWKTLAADSTRGWFDLRSEDLGDVPVRIFMTHRLLEDLEDSIYRQIVNAAHFPGVRMVCITPDAHYGYGVPVGSVIITDGPVAMGPVGYDIGCGMVSARSDVPASAATRDNCLKFNRAVIERIGMGAGEAGRTARLSGIDRGEFQRIIRGGADYYASRYGERIDRQRAERNVLPVDDDWDVPWHGEGRPERGVTQLGSLGGGNHFVELQRNQDDLIFLQVHTGSRGFGHGMATNYFHMAREERPAEITHLDLGYFTPDSVHYRSYLNAVAAGANYAIVNRLAIFEEISAAFRTVFKADLELVYEISHNLVQREWHPQFGDVWVHRKGATRALPAGHPQLSGTVWEQTGHPVLIPGSNKDYSYILRPLAGAVESGFSVNHGAGRRMARAQAMRSLSQEVVDQEYRSAGILVNTDGRVPLDESGHVYKSSREVVQAVTHAGLAEVEHTLWPIASVKAMDARGPRRTRGVRDLSTSQRHRGQGRPARASEGRPSR
jgi:tRNA-splicing ligase RtcB